MIIIFYITIEYISRKLFIRIKNVANGDEWLFSIYYSILVFFTYLIFLKFLLGTPGHTGALERQGSFQGRERMIAHSTALESITVEVDSMSVAGIGAGASGKKKILVEKNFKKICEIEF